MEKYKKGGVKSVLAGTKKTSKVKKSNEDASKKKLGKKLTPTVKGAKSGKENKTFASTPVTATSKEGDTSKKKNGKRLCLDDDVDSVQTNVASSVKKQKVEPEAVVKCEINAGGKLKKKKRKSKGRNKSGSQGNEEAERTPERRNISVQKSEQPEQRNDLKKAESNNISDKDVDKAELTVFVGNLPLSYDHKKVMKLFSQYGKVENARIRCVPVPTMGIPKKTTAITKNFHPNRKSVSAFVVFTSKESVAKALADNGTVVDGHHLRIDRSVPRRKDLRKSVFVGGLPFDLEDDELWDAFKDCGEIEDVRIIRDEKIAMGKGFGYVNFKSISSVELALKLNGEQIKNRQINVERCVRGKKRKGDSEQFQKIVTKRKKSKGKQAKQIVPGSKNIPPLDDFQGRKAELKQKKKKRKLTKDAAWKNKIKSVFQPTENIKKKKRA